MVCTNKKLALVPTQSERCQQQKDERNGVQKRLALVAAVLLADCSTGFLNRPALVYAAAVCESYRL